MSGHPLVEIKYDYHQIIEIFYLFTKFTLELTMDPWYSITYSRKNNLKFSAPQNS